MKTNFSINNNLNININDLDFDLHNNFDFEKISFDKHSMEIILIWKKSTGRWANDIIFECLELKHSKITFFHCGYLEDIYSNEDWNTLSTITYFPSNNRINNDYCTLQTIPFLDDDIIYTFENDSFIRIKCDKIDFVYK